jgi:hypothetical protein
MQPNNTLEKLAVVEKVRIKLEELKLVIRICNEAYAFPNFNSSQININQVIGIARQNEGCGTRRAAFAPHQSSDTIQIPCPVLRPPLSD